MTMKPEPWWPLKWRMSSTTAKVETAAVRGHPTISMITRFTSFGRLNAPFDGMDFVSIYKREGNTVMITHDSTDLGLRTILLSLAYPEGNDDTET